MNKYERKTYGQLLYERKFAEQMRLADAWDFSKKCINGMMDDVNDEIKLHGNGKYKDKSFYVMSLIAIETFGKAPITKTLSSSACPYPSLNQTVWKIDHLKEEAILLWALPDKKTANQVINDPHKYLNDQHDKASAKETIKWVNMLKDGELRKISDNENGNKKDMAVIIKEPVCG